MAGQRPGLIVPDDTTPLRAAGIADEDIIALGGKTMLNPLRQI